MGFLTKMLAVTVRATVGTAVSVIADGVTGFGIATDKDVPYTVDNLSKTKDDLDQSFDDLGNGDVL